MFLPLFGLIAGFIDSIAGGGGLITLPVLTVAIEAGPHAIGTNKIVGTVGALTALLVYLRKHPMPWAKSVGFLLGIVGGSYVGSVLSPLLDKRMFQYLLLGISPVILLIVLKKDAFIREHKPPRKSRTGLNLRQNTSILASGFIVGVYDGGFGPGGGTFMLLALIYVNRLPLFEALVLSKLANTLSAGISLVSYQAQGFVHWKEGCLLATGMLAGAYLGSTLASKRAERVVRPALIFVVLLLMLRISFDLFYRP